MINITMSFCSILGDTSKGELGCACIPDMSSVFDDALDKTIDLAKSLNCKMQVLTVFI